MPVILEIESVTMPFEPAWKTRFWGEKSPWGSSFLRLEDWMNRFSQIYRQIHQDFLPIVIRFEFIFKVIFFHIFEVLKEAVTLGTSAGFPYRLIDGQNVWTTVPPGFIKTRPETGICDRMTAKAFLFMKQHSRTIIRYSTTPGKKVQTPPNPSQSSGPQLHTRVTDYLNRGKLSENVFL